MLTTKPDVFVTNQPIDTKQLAEALTELNIARKNALIYPAEHAQVKDSMRRLMESMRLFLESSPEITITIVNETLFLGQDSLDNRNMGFRELAMAMKQHEIAAITFFQGIQHEEILSFLRLLAKNPGREQPPGQVEAAEESPSWPHITLQLIDYSQLHITEETEIHRDAKTRPENEKSSIWKDFVTRLVGGSLSKSEDAVSLSTNSASDPENLALLLNQKKIDIGSALQVYGTMLDDYSLNQLVTNDNGETATEFSGLTPLMEALNPEIRKQFLSTTFDRISSRPEQPSSAKLLSNISSRFAVDMLQQANQTGKEISPSLIHLVSKLAGIEGKAGSESGDNMIEESQGKIADTLQTLFKRESYEEFITSKYDRTLKQISLSARSEKPDHDAFPIEEYLPTLDEKYLNGQIARMLLAFISENIHGDEYRTYVDKLVEIGHALLDSGDFALIITIFETLTQHSNYKRFPETRTIAEKALKVFREPMYASKAVQSVYRYQGRDAERHGIELLALIGPQIVPDALNLFAGEDDPEPNRMLLELLRNYPEQTIAEAQKRFRDTRTEYVRRLVVLIREIGEKTAADILRPLWEHSDSTIQMEVLAALLKFDDKWGLWFLRGALKSNLPGMSIQAICLAEKYKVFEAAGDLAAMLKRRFLFKSDYEQNETLIRALGNIGNPIVVPVLGKLAGISLTFYPQKLTDMKVLLFRSLSGYPPQSVRNLLQKGSKSGNERIRKVCRQVLQVAGQTTTTTQTLRQ